MVVAVLAVLAVFLVLAVLVWALCRAADLGDAQSDRLSGGGGVPVGRDGRG